MLQYDEIPTWLKDVVDRYQEKPTPSEIRSAVQRAISELGCSQAELGELFGTNQQAVSRWLNHPDDQ